MSSYSNGGPLLLKALNQKVTQRGGTITKKKKEIEILALTSLGKAKRKKRGRSLLCKQRKKKHHRKPSLSVFPDTPVSLSIHIRPETRKKKKEMKRKNYTSTARNGKKKNA
jgi:hypothetical protein